MLSTWEKILRFRGVIHIFWGRTRSLIILLQIREQVLWLPLTDIPAGSLVRPTALGSISLQLTEELASSE